MSFDEFLLMMLWIFTFGACGSFGVFFGMAIFEGFKKQFGGRK